MSEDNSGNRHLKNSLLSAAATGFPFEDAATLLVPVNLEDESENTGLEGAISEIDLNSEEQEEDPASVVESTYPLTAKEACPHINLFAASTANEDPFSLLLSGSSNDTSSSSIVPDGLKASEKPFSLGSLWPLKTQSASPILESVTKQSSVPSPPPPQTTVYSTYTGHYNPPTTTTVGYPTTTMGNSQSPLMTPQIQGLSLNCEEKSESSERAPKTSLPPTITSMSGPPTKMTKGNSFRLGSQRPVYAQYPGLMGSTSPPASFPPGGPPALTPNEVPIATMPPQPAGALFTPFTGTSTSTTPTPASIYHHQARNNPSPNRFDFQEIQYRANLNAGAYDTPMYTIPNPGVYSPLTFHWFYKKEVDGRPVWKPFSIMDSIALDDSYTMKKTELVPTDGGRYDVDVSKRQKFPIYWEEEVPTEVRRCSWFYKGPMDSRFVPYEEELSERLEKEYYEGTTTGIWHRRLEFPGGEAIVLHNPHAMSHFCQAAAPDEWGNLPESQLRPRVVKRGVEEFEIEDGEATQIDHLVFLVHGIGAICDFKFRTIVEAVDDFRGLSFQLMSSHFKDAVDTNRAGRIEFLPVSWHKALHGDGGIDQKLKPITLNSIPKLRNFTNDTLLDILFYTSPVYAQTIVDTVGNELNRLFNLFLTRNPTFNGYVALSGHSLGSLILFDLLAHQPQIGRKTEPEVPEETSSEHVKMQSASSECKVSESESSSSRMVSYTVGSGTGQPFISYPTLEFEPTAFFALGSPIAMFVTVRGIDSLGENFHFPTCPAFFNIFHPFDPVAYRIETLIEPNYDMRPVLIPHHKGRKRFHLELKETMQRVGADLKQKFLDSVKITWNTVYQYATFSKGDNLEKEMERVIEGELGKKSVDTASNGSGEDLDQDVGLGKLNGGRRIDYVLQEAPLESFNEYLFALSSHVCYWESEDTMLMIMREIYASMGIFAESCSQPPLPALNQNQNLNQSSNNLGYYQPSPITAAVQTTFGLTGATTTFTSVRSPIVAPISDNYLNNNAGYPRPIPEHNAPPPLLIPSGSSGNNGQGWASPPLFPPSSRIGSGKPTVIGSRPIITPEELISLRGMDPTAPIATSGTIGPPPLKGFTLSRKQ